MTYSQNAPFRADVVGSYLRPAELKQARADFAAGKIDEAALKAVEDNAITELVAKQKAAGLHVITDGEFRRGWWHLDCMWGFAGVEKVSTDKGYFFHDEETRAESARLTSKIAFDPAHPERVYAATNCGLAVSTDGGQNWRYLNPMGAGGARRLVDVIVHGGGIDVCGDIGHRRSTDGGTTWSGPTAAGNPLPGGVCSLDRKSVV